MRRSQKNTRSTLLRHTPNPITNRTQRASQMLEEVEITLKVEKLPERGAAMTSSVVGARPIKRPFVTTRVQTDFSRKNMKVWVLPNLTMP